MHEVQRLVSEAGVDPATVEDTLGELLPLVAGIVDNPDSEIDSSALVEYATDKLGRRIEIITDTSADLPPVERLVHVEGGRDVSRV